MRLTLRLSALYLPLLATAVVADPSECADEIHSIIGNLAEVGPTELFQRSKARTA